MLCWQHYKPRGRTQLCQPQAAHTNTLSFTETVPWPRDLKLPAVRTPNVKKPSLTLRTACCMQPCQRAWLTCNMPQTPTPALLLLPVSWPRQSHSVQLAAQLSGISPTQPSSQPANNTRASCTAHCCDNTTAHYCTPFLWLKGFPDLPCLLMLSWIVWCPCQASYKTYLLLQWTDPQNDARLCWLLAILM